MKKIFTLFALVTLLAIGCKKDNYDSITGEWEVIERSPFSYEVTGSPTSLTDLPRVKPASGVFKITLSDDKTYRTKNTTYMSINTSGTYSIDKNRINMLQEKVNGENKPLVVVYDYQLSGDNSALTLNEIGKDGQQVVSVLVMKR